MKLNRAAVEGPALHRVRFADDQKPLKESRRVVFSRIEQILFPPAGFMRGKVLRLRLGITNRKSTPALAFAQDDGV
jgi:hypothetical protein